MYLWLVLKSVLGRVSFESITMFLGHVTKSTERVCNSEKKLSVAFMTFRECHNLYYSQITQTNLQKYRKCSPMTFLNLM